MFNGAIYEANGHPFQEPGEWIFPYNDILITQIWKKQKHGKTSVLRMQKITRNRELCHDLGIPALLVFSFSGKLIRYVDDQRSIQYQNKKTVLTKVDGNVTILAPMNRHISEFYTDSNVMRYWRNMLRQRGFRRECFLLSE